MAGLGVATITAMRNVLIAAGAFLLGVGLPTLVELEPALAPFAIAAGMGLLAAGLLLGAERVRAIVPGASTADDRREGLRLALTALLAQGYNLLHELAAVADDAATIEDVQSRASAWGAAVRDRLDRERPGWSVEFLDDSGFIQYQSQHAERDLVANWLERRTVRLRELVSRLQS